MDSSDFEKGECEICGEEFEICLISESIEDIGMIECEACHSYICRKHLKPLTADMVDENEEMLLKKHCPICTGKHKSKTKKLVVHYWWGHAKSKRIEKTGLLDKMEFVKYDLNELIQKCLSAEVNVMLMNETDCIKLYLSERSFGQGG